MQSDVDIIKSFHDTSSEINLGSDNEEDDEESHKMAFVQDAQKSALLLRHFLSSIKKLTLILSLNFKLQYRSTIQVKQFLLSV